MPLRERREDMDVFAHHFLAVGLQATGEARGRI